MPAPPRCAKGDSVVPTGCLRCFAGLILSALCGAAVAAEAYPARPIRLVLGVGTGGVGDVTMRLAAQQMSRSMGQNIVVENRPGAGGDRSRNGGGQGDSGRLHDIADRQCGGNQRVAVQEAAQT